MQNKILNNLIFFSFFLFFFSSSFALEEVPMLYEEEETSKTMEVKKEESRMFVPYRPLPSSSSVKTSDRFIDMAKEERYEDIREKANKTSALGSAMGAIDLGSTPAKKIRIGAGVGNNSDSQALAVGVGYAPTENLKLNTKISTSTDSTNNRGISVGASYDLDLW